MNVAIASRADDVAVALPASPTTSPSPPALAFSFKSLLVIYGVVVSDGIALNIINPFISEISRNRFGVSEASIGLAAGWLVGSFSVAVFFSSFFLGHLSDLYGRKRLMLLGLASGFVCTIAFGLSTSFAFALIMRVMAGITNANVSLTKTVISDVPSTLMSNEQRSLAFAYLGGVFQLSRAVAAGLAGVTTGIQVFGYDNDFFLPCFIGGGINCLFLIFAAYYLPETLVKKKKKKAPVAAAAVQASTGNQVELAPLPKQSSKYQRLDRGGKDDSLDEEHETDQANLVIVVPAACPSPSVDLEQQEEAPTLASPSGHTAALSDVDLDATAVSVVEEEEEEEEEEETETCSETCRYVFSSMAQGLRIVWADLLIRRINLISCLHAFGNGSFILLISLFGALDLEHGGLQLDPAQIGFAYVWFGFVCLVFQFFLYKRVYRRFGLFRTYLTGTLLLGSAAAAVPLAAFVKRAEHSALHLGDPSVMSSHLSDYVTSTLVFALVLTSLAVGFMVCLPIISTCLSHSVQGSNFRGLTQGVCQSLQSGVRGLGAMITGSAFSRIAMATKQPAIVFWCLAAINVLCFIIAYRFTDQERDRCTGKAHTAPPAEQATTRTPPDADSSSELRLELTQQEGEDASTARESSQTSESGFGEVEVELRGVSPLPAGAQHGREDSAPMLPAGAASDEPSAVAKDGPKRAPTRQSRQRGLYAKVGPEDEDEEEDNQA